MLTCGIFASFVVASGFSHSGLGAGYLCLVVLAETFYVSYFLLTGAVAGVLRLILLYLAT